MSESQKVNLVFEKVSFVSKISTILKATSDDDKPIPGYLYQEICNTTLESDGYCESTLEYLVDRLEKKSCHVKLKVIKLMRYIIEHGNSNFRLGLLKSSKGIMEATKFSGPPDPLHGNVPYIMVRKTAQELAQMLFDTEQTDQEDIKQNPRLMSQTHSTGLGSSSTKGSSAMEGFGNSPANQNRSFGDSVRENIGKIVDKITEGPVDYQRELLSVLDQSSEYKPPTTYHDNQPSLSPVTQTVKPKPAPVVKHTPGKAGGGWEEEEDEEGDNLMGRSQSSGKHSSDSGAPGDRLENLAIEDWSTEENHVKSTVDDEQNLLLTRQQIVNFMKTCGQLNCDKVLEFLNQRLYAESDAINMRSLLLIESFLMKDLINIEQVFKVCQDGLLSLYWSKQGPVKSKAKKIIRILENLQNIVILDETKHTSENLIDITQSDTCDVKNSPS